MPFPTAFFPNRFFHAGIVLGAGLLFCIPAAPLAPQNQPPSPVRYTEAREHAVRGLVRLPGSVESPTVSTIAGSVDGLVIDFPAKEGDVVKKGQVLAQLRTVNAKLRLEASKAELEEAEARRKLAQRNLDRAKELFDSEIFSRQEYDQSLYEFNAWQGRIDRLKAEIDRIQDDIDRATIRAPFDGVIVAERTELGQWLGAGDPVVELMSVDDLEIAVEVPERYLPQLAAGRRVSVQFEALGGWKTSGAVKTVIPRADPQARTFRVKLDFANPGGKAVAGMLAEVSFPAGETYRATIVPKDAVVRQGPQQTVYVINDNNTVRPVPVDTGAGVDAWIEVRGEVQPGQRVVTRGNERLRPGQPVAPERISYAFP